MRTKEQIEADIEEIRRTLSDPDVMDAVIKQVREGELVNSGHRRNGKIVWNVSDEGEQLVFLGDLGIDAEAD
jgi:uncharacterized protein with von Willebrand factor type A (vWA) domain